MKHKKHDIRRKRKATATHPFFPLPAIPFRLFLSPAPLLRILKQSQGHINKGMGDAAAGRYWCHVCSRVVNPVMEVEMKCPVCDSGFVEEMESWRGDSQDAESESDWALSLWAPILLGMMGPSRRRRRFRRRVEEDDREEEGQLQTEDDEQTVGGDGEPEAGQRRRRSGGAAILQLLRSLREGMATEPDDPEASDLNRLVLINPFHHAIVLQRALDSTQAQGQSRDSGSNNRVGASLGDYFIGPGLDLLLQHLAENDPSRYRTPPAQKEAVDAMPTVQVGENLRCPICIEDFEFESKAREMPCKHKFHSECILPWLELHSSCPVCRYQMPVDESKESHGSGNGSDGGNGVIGNDEGTAERDGEEGADSARRFWVPMPWPFNGLFSQSDNTSFPGNASRIDEN
ncbi:E3 ubiquitin-protein ligase SIRP1-like [Nymphaea colorata]|nr:E3 ubiquitin-protein ligase SIRP1-like [Nymphaea colorata]